MLWRTTGAWGSGLGRDLNADEIDGNFFELAQAVDAITAIGGINSIDDFTVVGDQMTVHMTDHTTRGPFTIPSSAWNDTGAWQPLFVYSLHDTFSINGTLYEVIFAHTSAASFDAGANNGSGSDYYHAIFSAPANALPAGGVVPQVLKKFNATDYLTVWGYVSLDELDDISLGSPVGDGDALAWDDGLGKWTNVEQVAQSLDDIGGSLGHNKTLRDKVQIVTSAAGILNIDRALGDVCQITLTENITHIGVIDVDEDLLANWGSLGFKNTLELYILNPDSFNITSTDVWTSNYWINGSGAHISTPAIGHVLWVEICTGLGSVVLGKVLLSA